MSLLKVPPELQHLIEKRAETERRAERRRAKSERRKLDLGPAAAAKTAKELIALGADERRSAKERRAKSDRRTSSRRKSPKRRA